ncbi:1446_t:CDS:2, partial [Gigaspora margarita]
AQRAESMKNKDTKKIIQEDRLKPKNKKVYFMIWNLPSRGRVESNERRYQKKTRSKLGSTTKKWSVSKNYSREKLNNKEEIYQERHRLEELVQRLVEEIKEKLIWELLNNMKIGAGYSNAPKLGATVVTKNIAIESRFSFTAKKDKGKELRVLK